MEKREKLQAENVTFQNSEVGIDIEHEFGLEERLQLTQVLKHMLLYGERNAIELGADMYRRGKNLKLSSTSNCSTT